MSTENKGTLPERIQACVAIANLIILCIVSVCVLVKFLTVEKKLADLTAERTSQELQAAKTPILEVEPFFREGPKLGKQFMKVSFSLRFANIGHGSLHLGRIQLEAYSAKPSDELSLALLTAAKRQLDYNAPFENTPLEAKFHPAGVYETDWTKEEALSKTLECDVELLENQESLLSFDYIVEVPARPQWYRLVAMVSPLKEAEPTWEARTVDTVISLGPFPDMPFGAVPIRGVGGQFISVPPVPTAWQPGLSEPPRGRTVVPIPAHKVRVVSNDE